jgi:hypothetical protein
LSFLFGFIGFEKAGEGRKDDELSEDEEKGAIHSLFSRHSSSPAYICTMLLLCID